MTDADGPTYRDLRGVMGPVDVERPAWAAQYADNDRIAFTVPWDGEVRAARVAGFSSREQYHGLPVIIGEECADLPEHGLSGQVVIIETYHVPRQEAGRDD